MSNDNNHISWLLIVCQILCYTIVQMVKFHLYKTLRSRCFVIPICLIRKVRCHPVTEGVTASSREGKQASSSHGWPQSACSWLFCFFFFILPHISSLPAAEVTHEEPGGQVWPQVTAVELLSYGAITVCQDCFMYLLLFLHFILKTTP